MARIDDLATTRKRPWVLHLAYVGGHGWEVQCPDPAVAVFKLEELLQEHGTDGVAAIAIVFETGDELADRRFRGGGDA